jgi:hypothetical protein
MKTEHWVLGALSFAVVFFVTSLARADLTLSATKTVSSVGNATTLMMAGGAPNQSYLYLGFQSVLTGPPPDINGTAGVTDAQGSLTFQLPAWTASEVGTWFVSIEDTGHGGSNTITLTVAPATPVFSSDRPTYHVGDTPTYTVTSGDPNAPVQLVESQDGGAFTNVLAGTTNAQGALTFQQPPWSSAQVGSWDLSVLVDPASPAGRTSNTIAVTVQVAPPSTPAAPAWLVSVLAAALACVGASALGRLRQAQS